MQTLRVDAIVCGVKLRTSSNMDELRVLFGFCMSIEGSVAGLSNQTYLLFTELGLGVVPFSMWL